MTKYFYLLLIVCLTTLSTFGQNEKKRILLLTSNQIEVDRKIILIENDSFLIATTQTFFLKYLKAKSKENKNFKAEYDSIYSKFNKTFTEDITETKFHNFSINIKQRLDFLIGDLLQLGKCYAFNRIKKSRIKKVTIKDYGSYDNGATGKRYFLDGILVLDNIELVF